MYETRVVLIGRTGSGKSSTGNTILGGNFFSVNRGFASQKDCKIQSGQNGDMVLEIVDCPGLDALSSNRTDAALNIMSAVAKAPYVHAFLYVVSLNDRYTHEDYRAYKRFKALFGNDINRHMIVVFTAAGNMLENKQDLDSMMQDAPDHLKAVLKECSGRYITLDNISNKQQTDVGRLLNMIRKMTTGEDGRPYVFSREKYCGKEQEVFDTLYTDYEEEHDCELQKEKEDCDVRDVRESVTTTDEDNKEEPWETIKRQAGHVSQTRQVFEGIEGVRSVFRSDQEKEERFRFLLLGKTGSGKSATSNTILGEKLFSSSPGLISQTATCDLKTSKKRGITIEIVDSPGLFDPERDNQEIGEEIVKTTVALHPGPHAVLYVLKLGRYTAEEFQTYQRLKKLFDKDIVKFTIIVFTGGDRLKKEKQAIEDILESAGPNFKKVLEECQNRVIVFNNADSKKNKEAKVKELLEMSQKITRASGEHPYRCTVQEKVGDKLEETVTTNVEELIASDPRLKEFFSQMEIQIRKTQELAEDSQRKMAESMKRRQQLEEDEKAKRLAREEDERERREKEEAEKSRRQEEIRLEKERLEVEKKKLELEKEARREREAAENLRKRQEELERQRDAERERRHREEMERMKKSVVTGGQTHWVADVAGGAL